MLQQFSYVRLLPAMQGYKYVLVDLSASTPKTVASYQAKKGVTCFRAWSIAPTEMLGTLLMLHGCCVQVYAFVLLLFMCVHAHVCFTKECIHVP